MATLLGSGTDAKDQVVKSNLLTSCLKPPVELPNLSPLSCKHAMRRYRCLNIELCYVTIGTLQTRICACAFSHMVGRQLTRWSACFLAHCLDSVWKSISQLYAACTDFHSCCVLPGDIPHFKPSIISAAAAALVATAGTSLIISSLQAQGFPAQWDHGHLLMSPIKSPVAHSEVQGLGADERLLLLLLSDRKAGPRPKTPSVLSWTPKRHKKPVGVSQDWVNVG